MAYSIIPLALVGSLAFASPVAAQSVERTEAEREARHLQWIGTSFMLAGITLEVLSYTALANKETLCSGSSVYTSTFVSCSELKYTNWSVMSAGLSLSVGGIVTYLSGTQKAKRAKALPSVTVGPSRVSVQQRYVW